jgi:uncharacterized protein (DUF1800 family)
MAAIRFGYGFRPGEAALADRAALLAQIAAGAASPPLFPIGGLDARRKAVGDAADRLQAIRKSGDADDVKRDQEKAVYKDLDQSFQRDADARIAQAVFSPSGFYERLASFWVNHFSVSIQKSQQMRLLVPLFEAEAIRPNIGAPFPVLLKAVTQHPAMLIYLDQTESLGPDSPAGLKRKKGLNENLGRELIELHTLGAGSGYTQDDVRSAAMVLTGIAIDREAASAKFQPGIAEPGSHQVLGVSYGGKPRREGDYLAMLDDLALNPKTARHICRKLAAHFIADQPPQDLIDAMVDRWSNTKADLTQVYSAMLDHPAAWSGEAGKARAPFDFIVAGLRAFNMPKNPSAGQIPSAAPISVASAAPDKPVDAMAGGMTMASSAGAMSGTTAISPAGDMAAAVDIFAQRKEQEAFDAGLYVPRGLGLYALRRMGQPVWQPPSPAGFADTFDAWINASALSERLAWARRAIGRYGKQDDPRQFLKDTLADAARDDTIRVVSQAPNRMTGLVLVLASPEFNRR